MAQHKTVGDLLALSKEAEKAGRNDKLVATPQKKDEIVTVRILPIAGQPFPFQWAHVHYSSSGVFNKTTFSPKTFGDIDPLEEFVDDQLKVNVPKSEFKQLIKLKSSPVYLTPCLVREEGMGIDDVKVKWLALSGGRNGAQKFAPEGQFGRVINELQKALRGAEDAVFFDLDEGYDMFIEKKVKKGAVDKEGKEIMETEYSFARQPSEVWEGYSSDPKVKKAIIKALKEGYEENPWDQVYERMSSEEMAQAFERYTENLKDEGDDTFEDKTETSSAPVPVEEDFDEAELLKQAEGVLEEAGATAEEASDDDDDNPFA